MEEAVVVEIAIAAVTGVLSILWYLMRQKDGKQQAEIDLLWKKHEEDVDRLRALELSVAMHHPERGEIDKRFDKLEQAIERGISKLSEKVDSAIDRIVGKRYND